MILLGEKEFFKRIGKITYEGRDSDNPMAFKFYNPEQKVAGKTMREHFKFAMAYWHTLCGTGADPFGPGTKQFPWATSSDPMEAARDKADAAFEFATKMGFGYYCFHDFDLVDEAGTLAESEKRIHKIVDYLKQKQAASGVKLLWGTANCFSNPRYMNGAASNPDFNVVAHAGAQVKIALDATIALNGENYVFWGGREGYMSLLNTNMKLEQENIGRFLNMAKDYARSQGFKGTFFIEPKPMEPTKHQYDFDAATSINSIREYGLENDFKLNIEVNHATLAQHTFQHELQVAANAGMLGSIDANRGDYQNGWDTDQFPNNFMETAEAMLVFLKAGGLQGGGINFDAKTRRNSTDLEDIFLAHIGGADTFARGLLIADALIKKSNYEVLLEKRYASFTSGKGLDFVRDALSLNDLYDYAKVTGAPEQISGKQELFENILNQYC
ncbi:xylose isomerase [Muricauda sp. SCSIO 64092]|uniref:xylose isomerase n=1 Tax=Allomuricauda sp. SCSIO 64092 TaxID=2908842 RepID=UPI001FF6D90C|nr:xylose isomerase [Muricauda sp. SCSIO 64092]UOY08323.1 xylose isomerase [Muricauda sp. SCSIO 64092]